MSLSGLLATGVGIAVITRTTHIITGVAAFLASIATVYQVVQSEFVTKSEVTSPANVSPLPHPLSPTVEPSMSGNWHPAVTVAAAKSALNALTAGIQSIVEGAPVELCGVSGSYVRAWRDADGRVLDKYTIFIRDTTAPWSPAKFDQYVSKGGDAVMIERGCFITIWRRASPNASRIEISQNLG